MVRNYFKNAVLKSLVVLTQILTSNSLAFKSETANYPPRLIYKRSVRKTGDERYWENGCLRNPSPSLPPSPSV